MSWPHYIDDFSHPIIGNGKLQGFGTKKYEFKIFKIYWSYREWIREEIKRKDFEESFTGQFIKSGFEVYKSFFDQSKCLYGFVKDKSFSPTLNWFGVSLYSPDRIFLKKEKKITMSLQGMIIPYNERYDDLFKTKSCRYIKIQDGETILYEDWTGNLPDQELINNFLNK